MCLSKYHVLLRVDDLSHSIVLDWRAYAAVNDFQIVCLKLLVIKTRMF